MRRAFTRIWEAILDHIGATIGGAIIALFIALYAPLRSRLANWAVALWTWLVTLHSLTLWGFLWLAFGIALVIAVSRSGREFIEQRRAERWRKYTDDVIEGVAWIWEWKQVSPFDATVQDIAQFARRLVPICPKCTANLDNIHLHHMTGDPEHDAQLSPFVDELGCPRGDYRKRLPPEGYPAYAEHVAHEIIRRARTRMRRVRNQ